MHIDQDMFAELATAAYAGDLTKAQSLLDLMRASAGEEVAALLMRARRAGHPLPSVVPVAAIPLPQPGEDPHSVFGGSDKHKTPALLRKRKKAA